MLLLPVFQNTVSSLVLLQIVYTTACCSNEPVGDADFLPLQVHYAERFSAAGRTRCACPCKLHQGSPTSVQCSVLASLSAQTAGATCSEHVRRPHLGFLIVKRRIRVLVCSGSFKKRDSGRNDDETLVSRLVDRCLRPVFEKGWANDTQVPSTSQCVPCLPFNWC